MSTHETGTIELSRHHLPQGLSDRIAVAFVKVLRFVADTFFAKRYGHRASSKTVGMAEAQVL